MNTPPYDISHVFCDTCDDHRAKGELDFMGLVREPGNICRYRCKVCGSTFERIFPSFVMPREDSPEKRGGQ